MTALLIVSLLVNALCMSAIMTEEMEHSAQHLVAAKAAQQLRAVPPAARHEPGDPTTVTTTSTDSPGHALPGASAPSLSSDALPTPLTDSKAALEHKQRAAAHALVRTPTRTPDDGQHSVQNDEKFSIDRFRLALLKRRKAREEGRNPSILLRPSLQLRGASQNPNTEPAVLVDSRGAFFDPKLDALVDANLLGSRSASKDQEAKLLVAEHSAAAVFLPQIEDLKTVDAEGNLVTVRENEAQQLAHGIFTWGFENPDTGDIRLDCTDTLANAGSNGGAMNRFWGGETTVDACGPRDDCADECAYKPCNVGTSYRIECPGNCGHYGADVFGGAGRTPNIFMDDSSVCRAALSVGVGSLSSPFFVDIEIKEAEPAYEGRLNMANGLTTYNYVWHKWDWAENPKYSMAYTSSVYQCCSNPGAGAVPHLGDFTPTAEFRMRYDGVKWVNRVAFTISGGTVPPDTTAPPQETPAPPVVPGRCRVVPQCPQDGEECCGTPDLCADGSCTPAPDPCAQPDPPYTCPCGGPYTAPCKSIDCSTNMAIQFNGAAGDGAELEDSTVLEGKFQEKAMEAVTVEMWLKDNTLPLHRTVYFGGGEFQDQGFEEGRSCITSGFALGQWMGMLTFDVATADGVAGSGCGVHVRSPEWVLGTHKGKWVHVAGTYDGVTGVTALYIDGKIVHSDAEGSGTIVWPNADSGAKFVLGRNGDFIQTRGGTSGMDGELDEIRIWTEARSLDNIIDYMHKTMPDNGAFGPYPMSTVALYFRFECQQTYAQDYHRLCSNAERPMAVELGSYPSTLLIESGAPIEAMIDPDAENCPALPHTFGPTSWDTWTWEGSVMPEPEEIGAVPFLLRGSSLTSDGENAIVSENGVYSAVMQTDGNFVVYGRDAALWDSGTYGQGAGPYTLSMQDDGNLVVYSSDGAVLWASGTDGSGGDLVSMQDDGNLVVYNVGNSAADAEAVWASDTMQGRAKTKNPSLKMPPGQTLKASGHQLASRRSQTSKFPRNTADAKKYVIWDLPGRKRLKSLLRKRPHKMSQAKGAALVQAQAWPGA